MAGLIDISHHNTDRGPINWATAKGRIGGVYMKLSEGLTVVDPTWQTDYAGAGGQKIPRGPYHFADLNDPVREANHFADQVVQHTWELVPVLDIETGGATSAWIVKFRTQFRARMSVVKRSTRFRVYSSVALLTGALNPSGWIDSTTTIWAARYAKTLGWDHAALRLWQNSSTANLPGFVGSVDTDQYMHGWTPAADTEGPPPVTSPIDKLTAQQSAEVASAAHDLVIGNSTPGGNPEGRIAAEIFAFRGLLASAVATLSTLIKQDIALDQTQQNALALLATKVAALQTALTAPDADLSDQQVAAMADEVAHDLEAYLGAGFNVVVTPKASA